MLDDILLPDPGPGGWSPEFLRIIRQAADKIIINPALVPFEGPDVWETITEEERNRADRILAPYWEMVRRAERKNMALKTPQAYLDEKVTRRRYGWLERCVNLWVLRQRKV
jgi:hypothetical protein